MSAVRAIVIVGGGAAGIGAATEAKRRGIDALIVEARDRLGGRAHTFAWRGYHLDLGCTWMHSADRNSLRAEAERIGAEVDRKPTNWFGQLRNLGWPVEEQENAWAAFEALEERMRASPPASDRASDCLDSGSQWNNWLNAVSGYINGAPLAQVSVTDWLNYDNAATEQNLRLRGGYGGLLARLGAELEHRLASPVTAISRTRTAVQLETGNGVVEAERAIVTVPTATLDKIRFDPPLEDVRGAARNLPLGIADKLFLSLNHAQEFPHDAHLLGNPHASETGSYFLNPMGMPVVEGFFGGDGARALEELGEKGGMAFAVDELAGLLGTGIRKRLRPIAVSRWAHEPWIKGSYSHACPGHAAVRGNLADAGDDRLAFAGEAVSSSDYSTAHGAYDSGVAAVTKLFGNAP